MKPYSATSFPNLKLRHLQFLLLLERNRHLGKAAAALQMSQPAASKLLAELERSIGAALFARGRTGVAPLPAAQPVLRFARVVLEEETLAVQALRSAPGAGVVRLGTLPTLPAFVLEGIRRSKSAAAVGRVVVRQDTVKGRTLAKEAASLRGHIRDALAARRDVKSSISKK